MADYFEQISLFEEQLTEKKIEKPCRLISFFSGIEAQYKALSFLSEVVGIPVESYKTCEWAYNSICACNAIHNRDFTDYSEGKTKEEMINRIRGISMDYNKPLTNEQLEKKPLNWIKNAYNNCIANHNLINIMAVHGKDLEIKEKNKYEYILTYSFPCQDLSLAGKRAGMSTSQSEEGGTRSGLLWEVERILCELYNLHENGDNLLPQILVMENVPQIHSEKDYPNFRKWMIKLEQLGYCNFYTDLNSKDYGIPQNRERTIMVSILGKDMSYKFPMKFKRNICLKDFVLPKEEVEERYYLSKAMVDYLTGINQKESKYDRGSVFERNLNPNKEIAATITTAAGQRATDNFIIDKVDNKPQNNETNVELKRGYAVNVKEESEEPVDGVEIIGNYSKSNYCQTSIVGKNGIAPTFTENHGQVTAIVEDQSEKISIRDATVKGYTEAEEGDGIDIGPRMKYHRGNVQKGMSQTLKTVLEVGVVVKDERDLMNPSNIVDNASVTSKLRIRKLTPKETNRLMAFTDTDYEHMREIKMTDSQIFHVNGDSIVVTVLIAVFAKLFGLDNRAIEKTINTYIERIKNAV